MRFTKLMIGLKDRLGLEQGQTMSEYALVLTGISATSVLAVSNLSTQVANAVINVVRLLP